MKKCYIAGGDSMEQNLSQYKIFYEVAKAGNISKAAKELYISQPAISKASWRTALACPCLPEAPAECSSPLKVKYYLNIPGRHLTPWTGASRN